MKPRKIIELQLRILAPKRLFGYCVERIGALGFTKLTKIKNSSSRGCDSHQNGNFGWANSL